MSKNMTAASTWTVTCRGIADGDPLNSANLADIPVQDLLNRTEYLKDAEFSKITHVAGIVQPQAPSEWLYEPAPSASGPGRWSNNATTLSVVGITLPLPSKGTITAVEVMLSEHDSPATQPSFTLYKADLGNRVSVGSVTEAAASASRHWLSLSVSEAIASGFHYWLQFINGYGGSAAAQGTRIYAVRTTVTP